VPRRLGTEERSSCKARGLSLFTAHGFMAPEAANVYTLARELAEHRGDSHQLFMAVFGLWQSANGVGSRALRQLGPKGDQMHCARWLTARLLNARLNADRP
jgi:hypothetical protein